LTKFLSVSSGSDKITTRVFVDTLNLAISMCAPPEWYDTQLGKLVQAVRVRNRPVEMTEGEAAEVLDAFGRPELDNGERTTCINLTHRAYYLCTEAFLRASAAEAWKHVASPGSWARTHLLMRDDGCAMRYVTELCTFCPESPPASPPSFEDMVRVVPQFLEQEGGTHYGVQSALLDRALKEGVPCDKSWTGLVGKAWHAPALLAKLGWGPKDRRPRRNLRRSCWSSWRARTPCCAITLPTSAHPTPTTDWKRTWRSS
jgi:hypothetical protein